VREARRPSFGATGLWRVLARAVSNDPAASAWRAKGLSASVEGLKDRRFQR